MVVYNLSLSLLSDRRILLLVEYFYELRFVFAQRSVGVFIMPSHHGSWFVVLAAKKTAERLKMVLMANAHSTS